MKIFVSGASGFIGRHVVPELVGAGHDVVGLVRSDEGDALVRRLGGQPVRGTLRDVDLLRAHAHDADGVVHLAFDHLLAFGGDPTGATDTDGAAIAAFGAGLSAHGGALVIASGLLGLSSGRPITEHDLPAADAPVRQHGLGGRHVNAAATLALAHDGVRSSVLRLPPSVHGRGDHGFMATLIDGARRTSFAGYLGDGNNRWPAVHVMDAARLFRLAVESAPAGVVLHAIGDEGVALRDIAGVIGRRLNVEVGPVDPAAATDHFSFLARFVGLDSPATATITRELLGWTATGPDLLTDLDEGHYFD